jgi:GGDEF domain-containing protein
MISVMRGGGQVGDGLTVRVARALAATDRHTHGYGVVLIRLLPAPAKAGHSQHAAGGQPGEPDELLAALARWVRAHLRAEDELIHEPHEGLALLVGTASPAAALLVAERLRDALAAPATRGRPSRRRTASPERTPGGAPSGDSRGDGSLVRLGLGCATAADTDDGSVDAMIRAAWRPRMLCSVSLATLLADHEPPSARADSPRRPAPRTADDAVPPAPVAEWLQYPIASPSAHSQEGIALPWASSPHDEQDAPYGAFASDPIVADASPSAELEDSARCRSETSGVRHLRLVPREQGLSEHEADALRRRASALGVPYMRLPPRLDADIRRALPPALARELRAVPVGRNRFVLTVAMEHPGDANAMLRLRAVTGLAIFPVLAAAAEITRALAQLE